jgi:hypothetical protein
MCKTLPIRIKGEDMFSLIEMCVAEKVSVGHNELIFTWMAHIDGWKDAVLFADCTRMH